MAGVLMLILGCAVAFAEARPTQSCHAVPEAATIALGPSGLAVLLALERRRRRFERIREGISFGYYTAKRTVDVALGAAALCVCAPVLCIVGLLVWLDNPGPVIYRRMVVGKNGKIFGMLKFRTMVVDAEEILHSNDDLRQEYYANNCKLKSDPRITRLGGFLRKTSLDELPQLFNVLTGDMTFVGPRPIAEDEVELYGPEVEKFKAVTPGITGLWQTRGRSEIAYDKRVELDMLYIRSRTLLLDLWIIVCTLPAVLLKKGAF